MKQFVLMLAVATMMGGLSATAQNRVKNISAESARMDVAKIENVEQPVRVSRYLYAGYNTLCLPMSMSAEQIERAVPGARVERLVAIGQEGTTLNLYFTDCTAEGIKAGMPYLFFSPTKKYLRVSNTEATDFNPVASQVRMKDAEGNEVAFGSSWELRQQDGLYGIPARQNVEVLESVLMRTTADQAFYPTRCGFSWEHQSATATEVEIKHIGSLSETTGIDALQQLGSARVDVYDLQGKLVVQQAKAGELQSVLPVGIYVVAGKKIVVK